MTLRQIRDKIYHLLSGNGKEDVGKGGVLMEYSALEVARYIVSYCNDMKTPISHLKLQKLLYFVWIEYFQNNRRYLFNDEFCAWQFGPVVPDVYFAFSSFAGMPIRRHFSTNISPMDAIAITETVEAYKDFSASELVEKTHKSGSPWDIIFQGGNGLREEIPFDLIVQLECE